MPSLEEVLKKSQAKGFLGHGDLTVHLQQGRAVADLVYELHSDQKDYRILDLGSGAGLPGLVIALEILEASVVLLDASKRRCEALEDAVLELDLGDRVFVTCLRAEEAAHLPNLRSQFSCVVARSFGAPPVTAECGSGFLELGGTLIVSDPPETKLSAQRWDKSGLTSLGLGMPVHHRDTFGFAVMRQEIPCPEIYPRRVGMPAKRPLF